MKLTKRQKKIFLFSSLIFFFVITVLTATFWLANKNSAPTSRSTPNDSSILTNVKTEAITTIERKLSAANNIKDDDLLQQLKSDHNLTAGENNWKEYLKGATTYSELAVRKKKILDIVAKLTETPLPTPPKTPTDPDDPTPTPQPGPTGPNNPSPPSDIQWIADDAVDFSYQKIAKKNPSLDVDFPGSTVFYNAIGFWTKFNDRKTIDDIAANLKDKNTTFLPANLGRGHWTLLAYNRNNNIFYYYNSTGSGNSVDSNSQEFCKQIFTTTDITSGKKGEIKPKISPQQSDGYNCGLYTIENMNYFLSKLVKGENPDQESFWEIPSDKRTEISSNITKKRSELREEFINEYIPAGSGGKLDKDKNYKIWYRIPPYDKNADE